MRNATVVLIVGLVVVGFVAGLAIQAKPREFTPARIAFVDMLHVIENYERAATIQQKLTEQAERIQAAFEKQKKALQSKVADLDLMDPETKAYAEALEKLETEKARVEFRRKWALRQVGNDARDEMKEIYRSVQDASERYAKETGIDAVFVVANRDLPGDSISEVKLQIAVRPVLYQADELDITEAVLGMLNAEQPK
jgi:Skp family chaperone for outer membrane proteins